MKKELSAKHDHSAEGTHVHAVTDLVPDVLVFWRLSLGVSETRRRRRDDPLVVDNTVMTVRAAKPALIAVLHPHEDDELPGSRIPGT